MLQFSFPEQGDQMIGIKFAQNLDKVAKTVAKPENAKMSSSKLNLNVQQSTFNPFCTLKITPTNHIWPQKFA
jgi:hypothetical protein